MTASEQLATPKPGRGRPRLALWILAPVAGLAVVFTAVAGLPAVECGEGGGASVSEETAVVAITALLSLAAFAGATVRLRGLRRAARSWAAHRTLVLAGIGAVLLTGLVAALTRGEFAYFFFGACLAGMLLAGVALLGLFVVWILGRGVEGAGGLLPLYLIGAGLLYPVVLLIGLLAQSGIGC